MNNYEIYFWNNKDRVAFREILAQCKLKGFADKYDLISMRQTGIPIGRTVDLFDYDLLEKWLENLNKEIEEDNHRMRMVENLKEHFRRQQSFKNLELQIFKLFRPICRPILQFLAICLKKIEKK